MEHLSTFGLSRDPFANEPCTEGWFESPAHQEAERRLARGVHQAKGLVLLLGEPGSGKTLLVRRLLESLEDEMFEACMLVPVPGVTLDGWVFDRLARQLGVEAPASDSGALLGQIYEQLAVVREDGRHTVVLIDEAQVLAEEGQLPTLRGLLNLEYEDKRLLTIVLVGPASLADAVGEDATLAGRVEVRVGLPEMDAESAADYLRHRIRSVGGSPAILETAAVDALVKTAGGSPRGLNTLADAALFEAHLSGRVSATAEDVARAAQELGLAPRANAPPARPRVAAPTPARSMRPTALPPPERHEPEALELEEVVAADTGPPSRGEAAMTMAIFDDPPPRGAADATVALMDEPRHAPPRGRAAAPETVALFADAPQTDDGELDDLFADLVED